MITIDGYRIDAVVSLDPSSTSEVTNHPVDEGTDVTDHIITRPDTVAITGVVSATPLTGAKRNANEVPVGDAYGILRDIQKTKRLVEIRSDSFPTFTDMALVSLSTAKTGPKDSLDFRATFQSINLVAVASEARETLVEIPRARKKQRRGAKPTKELDPEKTPVATSSNGKTVAASLVDLF
jgi:hypothetical protein